MTFDDAISGLLENIEGARLTRLIRVVTLDPQLRQLDSVKSALVLMKMYLAYPERHMPRHLREAEAILKLKVGKDWDDVISMDVPSWKHIEYAVRTMSRQRGLSGQAKAIIDLSTNWHGARFTRKKARQVMTNDPVVIVKTAEFGIPNFKFNESKWINQMTVCDWLDHIDNFIGPPTVQQYIMKWHPQEYLNEMRQHFHGE